ncbi:MAG: hypothetical protein KAU90_11605 [Sulfurovaceae bacterium]|nr:hypothetical protein [Sulfurovaceae bacterium]
MKKILLIGSTIILSINFLFAESDFDNEDDGFESKNSTFEKMKIKNRSKKKYKDKIYKYIKGDYTVENNNIELATIELDDNLKNRDVKINVQVEDLKVEGDNYKDSIDIKHNKYKNFVQNDEKSESFFDEEEKKIDQESDIEANSLQSTVRFEDRREKKVIDEDLSELEKIDLKGNKEIKEVNVFIEDTRIRVDD